MMHKKQWVAVLLIIAFMASVLLASVFIATHAQHKCTGISCAVCAGLSNAVTVLERTKNILLGIAAVILLALTGYFSVLRILCCKACIKPSLVRLKVKLSN